MNCKRHATVVLALPHQHAKNEIKCAAAPPISAWKRTLHLSNLSKVDVSKKVRETNQTRVLQRSRTCYALPSKEESGKYRGKLGMRLSHKGLPRRQCCGGVDRAVRSGLLRA